MTFTTALQSALPSIFLILAVMTVVAAIERIIPLHARGRAGRAHLAPNLALTFLTFATNAFMNAALAKHYRATGPTGAAFQRVHFFERVLHGRSHELQKLVLVGVDVGQHPKGFQCVWLQVLCFVDNYHNTPSALGLLKNRLIQLFLHADKAFSLIGNFEFGKNVSQQAFRSRLKLKQEYGAGGIAESLQEIK
jgi:hypothetical protein